MIVEFVGCYNVARVYGSEGWILIPAPWVPAKEGGSTKIIVHRHDQKSPQEITVESPVHLYGIEADTVAKYLSQKQASSPAMSWDDTLGNFRTLDAWRGVFQLNLFAPLALSRGFAQALHRGQGAIVNITSIAGHAIHPFAGSAYSTSKAALSALTREMAVEFAELGVRVNAVAPGEIETAMIGPEYESLIPRIPMHRMGTPEEVASAVFQLCNPDFSYVTGTEIFVTGGQHLF